VSHEPDPELDALLAEQQRYYRARAPTYWQEALAPLGSEQAAALRRDLGAAFDAHFGGDVLELACGPGTWTALLAQRAASVTAVDGAPEMLEMAAASAPGANVRFQQVDLFSWRPERRYDAVFFGFFLSHVPEERFASFWALVADALVPGGRVVFVDDAYRAPEELVYGPESSVIMRHRKGADGFRIVKMAHTSAGLAARLTELGWSFAIRDHGPFFWGLGQRSAST
jgi:demethylmenaquinone methyltransferase/2-methoxy-6-polyprenyl-1,4-benzoquinol methylase